GWGLAESKVALPSLAAWTFWIRLPLSCSEFRPSTGSLQLRMQLLVFLAQALDLLLGLLQLLTQLPVLRLTIFELPSQVRCLEPSIALYPDTKSPECSVFSAN